PTSPVLMRSRSMSILPLRHEAGDATENGADDADGDGDADEATLADGHAAHGFTGAAVYSDVVHEALSSLAAWLIVAVEPHRKIDRHPPGAVHREGLAVPANAAVVGLGSLARLYAC